MFQSLRTNNQLYILHKDANPFIEYGPVVSVSAPKPKYPMASPMGQLPQMEMGCGCCCLYQRAEHDFPKSSCRHGYSRLRTERQYRSVMLT